MTHAACKVLPHPSFVYCAKYHPDIGKLVVTGGFDRLLRLWLLESESSTASVCLLFYLQLSVDAHASFLVLLQHC